MNREGRLRLRWGAAKIGEYLGLNEWQAAGLLRTGAIQSARSREFASGEGLEAAYLAAGYKPGRAARFNASRLRNRPDVRARIDELLEQFVEATAVKVEYLRQQLLPALRANPQDLFEPGTDKLKSIARLPRELAAAIKTVKFDKKTGVIVEVGLADKIAAAGVLLRSVAGGVVERREVAGANGGALQVAALVDNLGNLNDDDLAQLAAIAAKAAGAIPAEPAEETGDDDAAS